MCSKAKCSISLIIHLATSGDRLLVMMWTIKRGCAMTVEADEVLERRPPCIGKPLLPCIYCGWDMAYS